MRYDPHKPLYHGAKVDFEKPKLNHNGILWLAPNPKVALEYSVPHWHKGDSYVWEFQLKPNAKVIELGDISNPIIRELRDRLNESFFRLTGPVTDDEWPKTADFGILESQRWVRGFLRKKRVDALTVRDVLSTMPIKHDSVALLNLGVIASMAKKMIPAGSVPNNRTIGEIAEDILRTASERVASRYFTAFFKPGEYILFGKFKNKRGKIVRIFTDDRGIPYIEIQPIPQGRKHNRIFGLYSIRKMSPEAIAESQAME